MTPRLIVATAAALLLCSPLASAQDQPMIDGYEFLPESSWLGLKNPDLRKKFYVEGRWLEFYRPGIRFFKRNDMGRFLIVPGTPDDPLYAAVVRNNDSLGNRLYKKESMVRVFGTPQRRGSSIALLVDKLEKLPDEDVQFTERLEALGGNLEAIRALAIECRARAKDMEDEKLLAVARSITQSELVARRKAIDSSDHKALLQLALRYERDLEDSDAAIAVYGELVEDPTAPANVQAVARRELLRKNAVRMRVEGKNSWVTYSEFKHAEGYVFRRGDEEATDAWKREDRWIRREWAELEDARSEELVLRNGKVVAVRTNLHQHSEAAKKGRVERGQNFVEVSRAIGFPRVVNHWPGQLEGKDVIWTQWVAKNGMRVYFVEGEVISARAPGTSWPSSQWDG